MSITVWRVDALGAAVFPSITGADRVYCDSLCINTVLEIIYYCINNLMRTAKQSTRTFLTQPFLNHF